MSARSDSLLAAFPGPRPHVDGAQARRTRTPPDQAAPHGLMSALLQDTRRPALTNGPAGQVTEACTEQLIRAQVAAVRLACEHMSGQLLHLLHDSVDRANCLPTRPGWEQKATAHAEIFLLLAYAAGAPGQTDEHRGQARLIRDLMHAVGPAANGMVISSRRRLLDRLRARDANGAALEMESHLATLCFMWRLAGRNPA